MFSDLVATWFVFVRSRLNSSFPASTGRNKKEISSLRGEHSNFIRGEWCFLSVIHMSVGYVCLCGPVCVCGVVILCCMLSSCVTKEIIIGLILQ